MIHIEKKRTSKFAGRLSRIKKLIIFPSSSHSHFLYTYFRFAYLFLCSPFRFSKNENKNFKLHCWFPQQILCGIAHTLAIFKISASLRSNLESMKIGEDGPVSYLRLFSSFGAVIFAAALYKSFWFDKKAYLKLIQFLDENSHLLSPSGVCCWIQSTPFVVSLCLIYCGFTIYYGTFYLFQRSNWSLMIWFKLLVAESRCTFLFETKSNVSTTTAASETQEPNNVTVLNILLALLEAFALQFRLFTSYFGDLCIFVNVLSLFIPLVEFTGIMRSQIISNIPGYKDTNNGKKNIGNTSSVLIHQELKYYMKQEIDGKIKNFVALKTLSELIGNVVGKLILPFLVEVMFHYPGYFNQVLVAQEVAKKFRLLFYFTTASVIVLLSAEITRNIRYWFRYWIGEQRRLKLVEENVLASVLHDLKFNKVGITATGIFVIDYSIVGAVASLSVTFFVVRLLSSEQFNKRM